MQLDDLSRWARGSGLEILLFLLGAMLLSRALEWASTRFVTHLQAPDGEASTPVASESAKHVYALVQAGERLAVALVWFITVLSVLTRFNVPMSTLLAPATAAGVALGLGGQRIVGDLLCGFFLISERQYGIGDNIQVGPPGSLTGISGTVEEVTLRVTRLRTAAGDVVVIPNGEIRQLVNRSKDWSRVVIDVPVAVGEDIDLASSTLERVGAELGQEEQWGRLLLGEPKVLGVETLDLAEVQLRLTVRTLPGRQWEVSRELRRRALRALQEAGVATAVASA